MRTALLLSAFLCAAVSAVPAATRPSPNPAAATESSSLGEWVVLAWNDLGMHCMNLLHLNFSVLPPYNNLRAQVIQRGDATHLPQLTSAGVTVSYSIPGNTYSVGKTDFWTYAPALFGVTLPPDIGLTGKGLTGTLDAGTGMFWADGIPITPFPDATPTVENAYQQALVIVRDGADMELARSAPTIPVSVDLSCVSSGCHASESSILNGHPREAGFDPDARPILCASCHTDPILGTTGIAEAGYFSFRIHDQHKFMDQTIPGIAGCYKCHPGQTPKCLRGTMATDHGLICQDCHGNMAQVSGSIELGRMPWVDEPRCGTCHTSQFAEEPGKLFKVSVGHGGIACEGCHNSTHAELPSREAADNANSIALQGFASSLGTCSVCHGITPAGQGPHGIVAVSVPGEEILTGARPLRVFPNPARGSCTIEFSGSTPASGLLMVHDAQGRIVRRLDVLPAGGGMLRSTWDGRDTAGSNVVPGTYFLRWIEGTHRAAARITFVR